MEILHVWALGYYTAASYICTCRYFHWNKARRLQGEHMETSWTNCSILRQLQKKPHGMSGSADSQGSVSMLISPFVTWHVKKWTLSGGLEPVVARRVTVRGGGALKQQFVPSAVRIHRIVTGRLRLVPLAVTRGNPQHSHFHTNIDGVGFLQVHKSFYWYRSTRRRWIPNFDHASFLRSRKDRDFFNETIRSCHI